MVYDLAMTVQSGELDVWRDALERSRADLAAGRIVDGRAMHARLIEAIDQLERAPAFAPSSET